MIKIGKISSYLHDNYLAGLLNYKPNKTAACTAIFFLFGLFAITVGLHSKILELNFNKKLVRPTLFIILFIFPSFLEESFFRGIIIPLKKTQDNNVLSAIYTIISSSAFTLWHPLNAWAGNKGAAEYFYDSSFLLITFVLGIVCSITYIISRSLWIPVAIHWIVVVAWVVFFGGRNLLL